jgi:hypothetical protein
MFANNYSEISAIFSDMYEGNINNLKAKEKIREIFQGILDEDYQNNEYVELRIINTYLEDNLYTKDVENAEAPALLHWNVRITQLCNVSECNLHNTLVKNELRSIGEFELPPIPENVTETIQSVLIEQVISSYSLQKCDLCGEILHTTLTTITLPYVIKLRYPVIESHNNHLYRMQYIDKSLILDSTTYDLVGVVYGDDEHFLCRYILNDNIYEADGMHLHELKVPRIKRFSAESVFITNNYEKGMPVKIKGTSQTPAELYYMKTCL